MPDSVSEANNENNGESANSRKKDIVLKKPQASLLQTYSQTWKHAHNHFMRYSDVRVREDRRPSVMDLANQPKVSQRVNGWKTHLISGEITELVRKADFDVESFFKV
jgi:histone deacetylase complex subunit SAP130